MTIFEECINLNEFDNIGCATALVNLVIKYKMGTVDLHSSQHDSWIQHIEKKMVKIYAEFLFLIDIMGSGIHLKVCFTK